MLRIIDANKEIKKIPFNSSQHGYFEPGQVLGLKMPSQKITIRDFDHWNVFPIGIIDDVHSPSFYPNSKDSMDTTLGSGCLCYWSGEGIILQTDQIDTSPQAFRKSPKPGSFLFVNKDGFITDQPMQDCVRYNPIVAKYRSVEFVNKQFCIECELIIPENVLDCESNRNN
jgi:hypothetical protein